MAAVTKRKNGTYIVRFVNERGKRKTITVGRSERQAQFLCSKVEDIVAARELGREIDPATAAWLAGLKNKKMRQRIANAGLLSDGQEEPAAIVTLGSFLDEYFAARSDVKTSTRINWSHTRRNLLDFFSAAKPLKAITVGDAKDFERYLKTVEPAYRRDGGSNAGNEKGTGDVQEAGGKGDSGKDAKPRRRLRPDTIRKRIGNAKQFFNDAVDRQLIERNPFTKLKSSILGNRDRDFFITRDMATKLIEAAPDAEWRLIIALSRYGGLRCPSEHVGLRLEDVDWDRDRIRVRSPKTEHHEGKAHRYIPLFPELRPYLEAIDFAAPPGTEYFLTKYRHADQNLRSAFLKIIENAGLTPWPKLFHNMRASRQTELENQFPSHVVCSWMGNSERVARRHYLQVTDEHFAAASNGARSTFVASDALQMAADESGDVKKPAIVCDGEHTTAGGMGGTELESVTSTMSKRLENLRFRLISAGIHGS